HRAAVEPDQAAIGTDLGLAVTRVAQRARGVAQHEVSAALDRHVGRRISLRDRALRKIAADAVYGDAAAQRVAGDEFAEQRRELRGLRMKTGSLRVRDIIAHRLHRSLDALQSGFGYG